MLEAYATLLLHTLLTPFLPAHEVNGAPMFQRHKSGFSLVELMIVVGIIGILGGIAVTAAGGCVTTSDRQASAERNARSFATSLNWKIAGVVCSGSDTPDKANPTGDGYVSCTVSTEDGADKALQCGYDQMIAPLGQNTACKLANPVNLQTQQ